MEKLFKILHKKYDHNIDKIIKEKKNKMQKVFSEDHLEYKEVNPFSYFEHEVIYEGILNKKKFEKAYLDGYAKMYEYFDNLDFKEKQRLMDYEIDQIKPDLKYFEYKDQKIYIPFFDTKLNAIYDHEICVFLMQQYRKLMTDYKDQINLKHYGFLPYASSFSSFDYAYGYKTMYTLYNFDIKRLYIIKENQYYDFITLEYMDDDLMVKISEAIFKEDEEAFVNALYDSQNIDDKVNKKLRKYVGKR